MARWLLTIASAITIALGMSVLGCDAGAADEPLCDAAPCAATDGAVSPRPADPAGPRAPAVVTPPGADSGPSATSDGGDPAADAGDDASVGEPTGLSCSDDDECPDPAALSECQFVRCVAGACVVIDDDDRVPEGDDNACTEDACRGGTARYLDEPPGTTCDQDGGDYCDGDGACVECVLPSHCDSDVCQDGECRPAPCGNGELDDGESDVDCGGECGGCGPGAMCGDDADCTGLDCTLEVCVPNCDDAVQNQGESDVDCGAACPSALCEDGDACGTHADCVSDFCHPTSGECATPSCSDGVRNGTETRTDCGGMSNGVTCPACPPACTDNWECDTVAAAGLCYDGFCAVDVHGCTVANSVDLTGTGMVDASQTAPIEIDFGGVLGSAYSPRCIKVTMGTRIRFVGPFSSHPMRGGIADGTEQPASTGPFTTVTNSGTSREFVMDDCAAYPYYCENHGLSSDMTGAVIVLLP